MRNIYQYDWVLFGASEGDFTRYLAEKAKNMIAVIDNDTSKWGKEWCGKKIYSPAILDGLNKDKVLVILANDRYQIEMKKQLEELGWQGNYIVAKDDLKDLSNSYDYFAYCSGIDLYNYEPVWLNLELSGICNCKCFYCPFHGLQNIKEGQKRLMTWDTLISVINQIKRIPSIKKLSTTGAGELFVNPEWYEMLEFFVSQTSISYVNMYTNGILLNEKNVEKLISLNIEKLELEISIDGKTPEENDSYRVGSDYGKIKKNIRYLENRIKEESACDRIKIIITNCYPISEQMLQIQNFKIDSKVAEVPEFLKKDFPGITLISQYTFLNQKTEDDASLKTLKSLKVSWPDNFRYRCLNLFQWMAINNKGELLRCPCGYAGIEAIGNVFKDDIYTVWKEDEQMNQARKNFIKGNMEMDFCKGCPGKGIGEYYLLSE